MAIDTNNEKLAIMEWCIPWEPGLPMVSTDTIDQADQQQFLNDFPGILWSAGAVLAFILDLNTRLKVYLMSVQSGGNDLTSMMAKDLAARSGDMSVRFLALIDDATP